MPRGKYVNHKGRGRRFTSNEELEEQRKQEEKNRQRRLEKGDISTEESSEEASGSGSGSEESETDEDAPQKVKGVENLIEVENPNRIQRKPKKAVAIDPNNAPKPELTRREREEMEKARATAQYQKLHAEGRTAQARADLARLAIVKQQREEAAKRREAERLEKEAAKQSKTQETQRALGKKVA